MKKLNILGESMIKEVENKNSEKRFVNYYEFIFSIG